MGSTDNENVMVLPLHLFTNATDLLSLEQLVYEAQEEHKEQMEELQREYSIDQVNERWFNSGQPVVPDNEELKRNILCQHHDHEMAGHPGISNTVVAVIRESWWPEI
jgi:hypothetical protein